jgi:hypothetical protein
VAVCFDRADDETTWGFLVAADRLGIEVRAKYLHEDIVGPRCPARAWNTAFSITDLPHAFALSSDCILTPHSIGLAYHLAEVERDSVIVAMAAHCGPSYHWYTSDPEAEDGPRTWATKTMTSVEGAHPLGFAWLLPMDKVRAIGGYDEAYMDGLCYEDDDFTARMWGAGADFIFSDDIRAFHMEHPRPHLIDTERVERNAAIFRKRYGDEDYIRKSRFTSPPGKVVRWDIGFAGMFHEDFTEGFDERVAAIVQQEYDYGKDEPWRAVYNHETRGR